MIPYRLHRSIPFWSGLFCLAFLLWAWVDSLNYGSFACTSSFEISSFSGRATLLHLDEGKVPDMAMRVKANDPNSVRSPSGYHHVRSSENPTGTGIGYSFFTAPYSLLVVAFTAAWLALLLWRLRRHRRLTTLPGNPHEEVPPPAV